MSAIPTTVRGKIQAPDTERAEPQSLVPSLFFFSGTPKDLDEIQLGTPSAPTPFASDFDFNLASMKGDTRMIERS